MQSNKALDVINKMSWEYQKATNTQYSIKNCPFCGNDNWKFYMNYENNEKNGLWDCKVCGESGNIYMLEAKLGGISDITSFSSLFKNKKPLDIKILEEKEKNLEKNKEALEYLTKTRGFSIETIKKFRIGLEDNDWILIPHIKDGKLWNIKSRNFRKKSFKRVFGQPSIPFNLDSLDSSKKTLMIVEGETDCIAATILGVKNVIGLTVGASSFPPEWIPFTLRYKEIYICLNSDIPGQNGAIKIAEKLGLSKCKNIMLPTKDINEYLLEKHSKKDFYNLIKEAKSFNVKNISSIKDYVSNIDRWFEKEGSLSGLNIPFPKANSYLKGFKEEDLIVLIGDTGVGKTTFSLNILREFMKNEHKCLGFFLEGKIMYYILRMMCSELEKEENEIRESEEEWEKTKEKFSEFQMYFYSGPQADLTPEKLIDLLKVAVKMYDIEFVLIDNLQKFVRDNRDVVHSTSQTVSTLKKLATDLKIPILLISHIHNIEKDRKRIMMHDAKQSSTIRQEADIILSIWNNKKNREDLDDLKLTIEKNRMGEGGIDIDVIFENKIGIYRERLEGIDESPQEKRKKRRLLSNETILKTETVKEITNDIKIEEEIEEDIEEFFAV